MAADGLERKGSLFVIRSGGSSKWGSLQLRGCKRVWRGRACSSSKGPAVRANGVRSGCQAAKRVGRIESLLSASSCPRGKTDRGLPRTGDREGDLSRESLLSRRSARRGRIGLRPASNPTRGERGEPRFPERAWGRWRKKLRFLFKPASSKRERRAQAGWRQLRKRGTGI